MEIAYVHTEKIHNTKAASRVIPHILRFFSCRSVLDVGCGTGTWLKVFKDDHGISDVTGIDGSNALRSQMLIPDNHFHEHDLRKPFDLKREFDIVLSLEVAEHLPANYAATFIDSLCKHSSVIVFSAAIPGQGGQNHLNEQWPQYWQALFKDKGYERIDAIRPFIWNDPDVDIWYRQNIFVFTSDEGLLQRLPEGVVCAEVHPDLWMERVHTLKKLQQEVNDFDKGGAGVSRSFRALVHALRNRLKL